MSDIAANCSAVSPADTTDYLSDDPSDLFARIGKGCHTLPIKDGKDERMWSSGENCSNGAGASCQVLSIERPADCEP